MFACTRSLTAASAPHRDLISTSSSLSGMNLRLEIRDGRYIACDMHAHLVSKAGSLISAKSPSPVVQMERYLIHGAVVHRQATHISTDISPSI